jgi:hydrogenase expression/formation protein HypE
MPDDKRDIALGPACPVPLRRYPEVLMAHGGGGKLTQQLIEELFLPAFDNTLLARLHDGAVLGSAGPEAGAIPAGAYPAGTLPAGTRLAFTTDSYVVNPIFFPGGDIGSLAVHGTVNDLAMCGARPIALSAALIIEEGFSMETLARVVGSMQAAAKGAGVAIVTGDTKVVNRGKGDGIYITTSGVGLVGPGIDIDPARTRPGDRILINGPIAQHGIAIMSVREGLGFETAIASDSSPLNGLVAEMLAASTGVRVLRDPTRGGVASALNEIAGAASLGVRIDQAKIPVDDAVKAACEILGFDPLYVANEGKVLAFVAPADAEKVLAAMKRHPLGARSAIIGEVVAEHPGTVVMDTAIGGSRVVDMMSGEQLPRIC